mgnify:FL=1|tara:strand:+ start:3095 stop:3421 length:327 start_codon:yes stop_codon:yes gene_type:complete
MSYSHSTVLTKSLSSKEDNQTYVFDIKINEDIIIREVINNKAGFIRLNKKIKFKKVYYIICKLLDLKYFKEYSLETNNIGKKNILMNDKFALKLENYEGNLTIFYQIN